MFRLLGALELRDCSMIALAARPRPRPPMPRQT
jgi:hypothetical protein